MAGTFYSIVLQNMNYGLGLKDFRVTSDMFYEYYGTERTFLPRRHPNAIRFTEETATEIAIAWAKQEFGDQTEWEFYRCTSHGDIPT